MIFKAFFWKDSIRSLRYFGSAAHAGEAYSSAALMMMLQLTETRLAKESPLFFLNGTIAIKFLEY